MGQRVTGARPSGASRVASWSGDIRYAGAGDMLDTVGLGRIAALAFPSPDDLVAHHGVAAVGTVGGVRQWDAR